MYFTYKCIDRPTWKLAEILCPKAKRKGRKKEKISFIRKLKIS